MLADNFITSAITSTFEVIVHAICYNCMLLIKNMVASYYEINFLKVHSILKFRKIW